MDDGEEIMETLGFSHEHSQILKVFGFLKEKKQLGTENLRKMIHFLGKSHISSISKMYNVGSDDGFV